MRKKRKEGRRKEERKKFESVDKQRVSLYLSWMPVNLMLVQETESFVPKYNKHGNYL